MLNQTPYTSKSLGNALPFLIGKGYAYPGSFRTAFFDGTIDEFRVYNRALTQPEIQCYYERRKYASPVPTTGNSSEESAC